MKCIIVGKNLTVTPALDQAVKEKMEKLDRFFNQDTEAHVTLSVEKNRQKAEVTIPVRGTVIRSEQVSNDMYLSIDLAGETIERQLKKYKNKIEDSHHAGEAVSPGGSAEEDSGEPIRIIRTKQFDMKPLYPEEACVQMELLGHDFYMFVNAETEQVNVVYKRKGGSYGLIEPET